MLGNSRCQPTPDAGLLCRIIDHPKTPGLLNPWGGTLQLGRPQFAYLAIPNRVLTNITAFDRAAYVVSPHKVSYISQEEAPG